MKETTIHPIKSTETKAHSLASLQELLGMDASNDECSYTDLHHNIVTLLQLHDTLQRKSDIDSRDIDRLMSYIDKLEHDINAVQHSLAWRVGYRVVTLAKKLLGRGSNKHAFEHMNQTFTIYHHWKKARG